MRARLQKILSGAGVASRRAAEKLILEGRVEVNGVVVRELGSTADPEVDDVRVDGTRVRPDRPRRYVALHKPRGYVTTRSDPGHRQTVMDLLPPPLRSLYPVGRLDMASTGLLILTDDGALAQRITHPSFGVEKSYLVTLSGRPEPAVLERAQRGIVVDGERLALEKVEVLSARPGRPSPGAERKGERTRLRATLRRGKNREIRRLFEALGFPVVELHRERIGSLTLKGIPPGGFRPLSREEVDSLRRASPRGRPKRGPRVPGAPPSSRARTTERRASRHAQKTRHRH